MLEYGRSCVLIPGWVKINILITVFIAPAVSMHHLGVRTLCWIGTVIMCQSGVTCLSVNCFSELALYKLNSACWSRIKQISLSSHKTVICSRHDIAEKLLIWH